MSLWNTELTPLENPHKRNKKAELTAEAVEEERVRLKKIIEDTTTRIEELERELAEITEIDNSLEGQLSNKRAELQKTPRILAVKRRKLEKEISTLQEQIPERERKNAIERDKNENPFKYFLIDKLGSVNLRIMFGKGKEQLSVRDIDNAMTADGREVKFYDINLPVPIVNYAIAFSSNGFYLKINKGQEQERDASKILYTLIGADGTILDTSVSLERGKELLKREAEKYQGEQIALFEAETKK